MDMDTSQATRAEVCAWGYDIHFILHSPPQTSWNNQFWKEDAIHLPITLREGQALKAHYHVYALSGDVGNALMKQSIQPSYRNDFKDIPPKPAFRFPDSNFQDEVSFDEPDPSWYWLPSHSNGLIWDQNHGRLDNYSLCIQNDFTRKAWWQVPLGPDFWMGPFPPGRVKLSGWIRSENLEGIGAYLSFRYSNYLIETGQRPKWIEYTSKPILGNHDWTYVEFQIEAPPKEATRAYLTLVLEGVGTARFDDLSFEQTGP
jgi:hypothetical protein